MVSDTVDGCAPLFLACKNGSDEVAEYLITRCNADIEQKGMFEVEEGDEGGPHRTVLRHRYAAILLTWTNVQ